MVIRCPACGFAGRVPDDKGTRDTKRIVCPSCGHHFVVGLAVLPADGRTPAPSGAPAREPAQNTPAPPGEAKKKKRRPFLWGCLIVLAALAIGAAILFLVPRFNKQIQESKEYDIMKKLGEKHPGYLLLNSIASDAGSMTELQITSYERGLVGKGCVGMGKVVDIQKTVGSAVLDFLGLTSPGTIIRLTYDRYDVDLVLKESYSDEFLAYGVGDTVLFAGIIKAAVINKRIRITLVDVVIEGHRKGEAGWRPPETGKSLSRRFMELLLK